MVGRRMATPFHQQVIIDLSFWSLPKYTLLSLGRGFAAYFLSLAFTLFYGTYAAHHRRAETIMLPILDVLQAIPVLGFLPGLVLALVALFPRHELGLEMACIVMIFTGQVWNMTFSFHGSLKAIPPTLREVAAIHQLSQWRIFKQLEVPSAMIGLVWNSMMSMAGGWFFLTVTEAFTLKNHDYRLPGIGSYMNEAILANVPAMIGGVVAMVLMIVFADQVVWRPLAAWSQKFKVEDVAAVVEPHSWVLDLARRSTWLRQALDIRHVAAFDAEGAAELACRHPRSQPDAGVRVRNRLHDGQIPGVAGLAAAARLGGWSIVGCSSISPGRFVAGTAIGGRSCWHSERRSCGRRPPFCSARPGHCRPASSSAAHRNGRSGCSRSSRFWPAFRPRCCSFW